MRGAETVAASSSRPERDAASPGRMTPPGSPASTELIATTTRGSGDVAGTFGSAPVRRVLLKTVWAQALRSRLVKPMLVAQIMLKSCWLTLCCSRALSDWTDSRLRPPLRQRASLSRRRGRPDTGSTLRE